MPIQRVYDIDDEYWDGVLLNPAEMAKHEAICPKCSAVLSVINTIELSKLSGRGVGVYCERKGCGFTVRMSLKRGSRLPSGNGQ